jgi:hypothetical protein
MEGSQPYPLPPCRVPHAVVGAAPVEAAVSPHLIKLYKKLLALQFLSKGKTIPVTGRGGP